MNWMVWMVWNATFVSFSITSHVWDHSQSRSHIALRLRLWPNDAAPCGSSSGSATLHFLDKKFCVENNTHFRKNFCENLFFVFMKIFEKISQHFHENFRKNRSFWFSKKFSRKSEFFVFTKIFAKIIWDFCENFRENELFSRNEILWNFAKICPFLHDFRIFAKTEKCIFVSTLFLRQGSARVQRTHLFVLTFSSGKYLFCVQVLRIFNFIKHWVFKA
jgi:hypothetical protein